ncbi:MAG: yfiK [Paenibacillus sp.]|jgi:DNA-binding NarL/FixJ family response regulator|nr:yfiK [Paenibacillus sp.]
MIRVMVVDDQRLMREGLATIIGLEKELEIVGLASNGLEAYKNALELKPDVMLMDIRMPVADGVEGTRLVRRNLSDVKVLMLTTFDDSELIFKALEQGAHGYLLKDMPSEAIVSAIHTVHSGGMVFQPSVTAQILEEIRKLQLGGKEGREAPLAPEPRLALLDQLSEREMEVLRLLGRGMNNKEIARELTITEGTVKNHVSNLIAKLDFRDRTQIAVFAVRQGIVNFEP